MIRARTAPQIIVLVFTMTFIAGGLVKWLNRDSFVGLPGYFGAVLVTGGVALAWFRAFRIDLTNEGITFRSLWGRRAWAWADILRGYVEHDVASGSFGGFRPVFRLTLYHRNGSRMDIPYNVCGLQALTPLLDRLRRDQRLVPGERDPA